MLLYFLERIACGLVDFGRIASWRVLHIHTVGEVERGFSTLPLMDGALLLGFAEHERGQVAFAVGLIEVGDAQVDGLIGMDLYFLSNFAECRYQLYRPSLIPLLLLWSKGQRHSLLVQQGITHLLKFTQLSLYISKLLLEYAFKRSLPQMERRKGFYFILFLSKKFAHLLTRKTIFGFKLNESSHNNSEFEGIVRDSEYFFDEDMVQDRVNGFVRGESIVIDHAGGLKQHDFCHHHADIEISIPALNFLRNLESAHQQLQLLCIDIFLMRVSLRLHSYEGISIFQFYCLSAQVHVNGLGPDIEVQACLFNHYVQLHQSKEEVPYLECSERCIFLDMEQLGLLKTEHPTPKLQHDSALLVPTYAGINAILTPCGEKEEAADDLCRYVKCFCK